jgi:hypothetical protein
MSKIPDNFHKDFPARMSDGRFITDYYPNCSMNLSAQKNMSSWQYKLFLTRNATQIMGSIRDFNHKKYGCDNCNDPSIPLQNQYLQNCTNYACHISEVNPKGVGLY